MLPQSETKATRHCFVTRWRDRKVDGVADSLIVEEPLEIRISGRRFTATMRTPGHDDFLARGLLFSEGVIRDNDDIESLQQSTLCRERGTELINVVDVTLHDPDSIAPHLWERSLISNSSCGLCGKASVEAMTQRVGTLQNNGQVSPKVLLSLPQQLHGQQTLFSQTGGCHAAAIFTATGELLACFEDIGRHNAVDKCLGFGLGNGWLPWAKNEAAVLLVSGRASFEIVQKALMARIPIVTSVSAASSLAVELAVANNFTLVAFLREQSFSVLSGKQRLAPS